MLLHLSTADNAMQYKNTWVATAWLYSYRWQICLKYLPDFFTFVLLKTIFYFFHISIKALKNISFWPVLHTFSYSEIPVGKIYKTEMILLSQKNIFFVLLQLRFDVNVKWFKAIHFLLSFVKTKQRKISWGFVLFIFLHFPSLLLFICQSACRWVELMSGLFKEKKKY